MISILYSSITKTLYVPEPLSFLSDGVGALWIEFLCDDRRRFGGGHTFLAVFVPLWCSRSVICAHLGILNLSYTHAAMSRANSVTSSEIILKDDERLVHFVGMIYRNREDQNVVDVNLERIATYAQQLDDLDNRRQIIFISPAEMYRSSDNESANICGELARRYRPRNLKLLLSIEYPDQTHLLYQNYGD